jgi:plasmid stabilization system protein ParE
MVRKIRWSSIAYRDFTTTLKYYRERNKSSAYSRKLVKSIDQIINLLAENPKLGRQTSDPRIRVYIIGHYKIFYEAEIEVLLIQMFWDTRRNPDELKEYLNQ